jgi:hypothetical protein
LTHRPILGVLTLPIEAAMLEAPGLLVYKRRCALFRGHCRDTVLA